MTLSASELDAMDACVVDAAMNRTVTVMDAAGVEIETGVACWIGADDRTERATGRDTMRAPIDATMRCLIDPNVRPGNKILVTAVNGLAVEAPDPRAISYEIQAVADVAGLGRQYDCKLWRLG